MIARSLKSFAPLLLAATFAATVPFLPRPAFADTGKQRPSAASYHDLWRKLWEDHITWTRLVIMGTFDNLPGLEAYKVRLLKNYEDMEDALKPYYGDDAEVLGDLIQDHLLIAVDLLNAAKAGNTTAFNDASARWYANGHDIAVKMAGMNPQYWPLSMGDPMWKEHLDATLDEAVQHSQNNFTADIAAYDKVVDLAMGMADFMSDGVVSEFHNQFRKNDNDQGNPKVGLAPPPSLRIRGVLGNPVRESAAVGFAMERAGTVRAAVYDLGGRQVRELATSSYAAGDNELRWDLRASGGARVAPGVYLLRLDSNGESASAKVMVSP